MRALVTGAAGFIGSNLVDRLIADGDQVVGVDNLSTGNARNLEAAVVATRRGAGSFMFVPVDVQAPELAGVIAGANPDVVFHLAAQVDVRISVDDPLRDARCNVLGTINVVEACRLAGVRRIVYAASGGSRYGSPPTLPVAETAIAAPESPYAVAKLAGELYLGAYSSMYGLTPICLALANVYGPRQNPYGEAGVIAMFGKAMIEAQSVMIYGDGTAARDYVYVDDVAEAFVRAAGAPADTIGTFNIGTGAQTTVSQLHELLARETACFIQPHYAPARTGELQAIALDVRRAERDLGWTPKVDVAEGIRRTVQWLRFHLGSGSAARQTA